MIAVVWAMIGAVCGILWLAIEMMTGMIDAGQTVATRVIWFVVPILIIPAAMLHARSDAEDGLTYMQAVRTGLGAGAFMILINVIVLYMFTQMVRPDYLDILVRHDVEAAVRSGAPPSVAIQKAGAASAMFGSVGSFLAVTTIVSGVVITVVSLLAAIVLRKRA